MLKDASGNLVLTKGLKVMHIIVAIVMIAVIVTLSVFLGIYVKRDAKWGSSLENNYRASYYTLMDSLFNIENNFAKLEVSKGTSMQEDILLDIALESQIAASCVNNLSYSGYDMTGLLRFCNQTGDYAKYAIRKLQDDRTLDEKDIQMSIDIRNAVLQLSNSFAKVQDEMFSNDQKMLENMNELSKGLIGIIESMNNTIKYPSLIYDGPFSEALEKREAKYLKGEDISEEQAIEICKKYLPKFNLQYKLISMNELNFPSYLFEFTGDRTGSIQIAKKGGALVDFDIETNVKHTIFEEDFCIKNAIRYCESIGLTNMTPVWSTIDSGILYINLCYTLNGVIVYPDMVKIKVSMQSSQIVGFEGLNYIYNHTDRELQKPVFGMEQIMQMDYGDLIIENRRLTIIPTEFGTEKLAYELSGKIQNQMFFIYVDAMTGKECKVMRVVESDNGKLLM